MKKILATFLLLTTTALAAAKNSCAPQCKTSCTNTNKTILIPRSHGVNLALEYTNGWLNLMYPPQENLFGSAVQLSFFYESLTNGDEVARYFSPTAKNVFNFGARFGTDQTLTQDLDFRSIIHKPADNLRQTDGATVASMSLKTHYNSFGGVLHYHQYLDTLLKGLYIKFNIPVVHIEHKLQSCITGQDTTFSDNSGTIGTLSTIKQQLQDYFAGNPVSVVANKPPLQDPLICPLIPQQADRCNTICAPGITKQKTGIADIDIILGYYFLKHKHHHAAINFGFTIPTGNEPDGLYLFEPVCGNGSFWGVGFGLSGHSRFLRCDDHSLSILGALNYRYLIEHEIPRKLGLCNKKWSQYLLLGQKGERTLAPAGNNLIRFMNVTPGSQIDFILQADYQWKRVGLNIGYNLFYRDKEELKYTGCQPIIAPNTFAFPSKEYNPYAIEGGEQRKGFGLQADGISLRATDFADPVNPTFLTARDIDISVAASPSLLSHKIYGGVSYHTRVCKSPFLVGIGAHYEFGRCAENLDTWAVNAQAGITF